MPLVIVPVGNGYSFVTAAGSYDAVTKEFTPNPGIEVDENYVKDVQKMIQNKWTYAKLIITNNYYDKVFPDRQKEEPKPVQEEKTAEPESPAVNDNPNETDTQPAPESNENPPAPENPENPPVQENNDNPETPPTE